MKPLIILSAVAAIGAGAFIYALQRDNTRQELLLADYERHVQELLSQVESGSRQRLALESQLEELQSEEGDQPVTVWEDLEILKQAGLEDTCALWLEYREAVTAGRKPGS